MLKIKDIQLLFDKIIHAIIWFCISKINKKLNFANIQTKCR